jgi:arylsulfatase A
LEVGVSPAYLEPQPVTHNAKAPNGFHFISMKTLTRRTFLQSCAALLCAAPLVHAQEKRQPNIVLIFTDDQAYADVGVFGAKSFRTPNLDRLAREGGKFTNFHVAQPVCSASRAALLTGCYPNRIGIGGALGPNSKIGLAESELTLAQMLKNNGYATGMVGKWHLGDAKPFLPVNRGFDEYFGIPYSHDMWPRHPENPKAYPILPLIEGDKIINPDLQPEDLEKLTADYTQRAVDFIEKNKTRPFFLYLAHNLPHVPLYASDKFKGKSAGGLYGDVMEEIDWSVGQVLNALAKNNLENETWVIFTSDNGPWLSYGEHAGSALPLREGKGTSWEGGVRVPCLMRWPGKIPAGLESDAMLMTLDLMPTIAARTGAKLPAHTIDGKDVWPLLSNAPGAKNPHEAYYFYYENNQLQAVASGDGRWKLVLPHGYRTLNGRPGGKDGMPVRYERRTIAAPQLFDFKNDIAEEKDVAAMHPEIVAQLQAFAEKARADLGDSLTNRKGNGVRPAGRIP